MGLWSGDLIPFFYFRKVSFGELTAGGMDCHNMEKNTQETAQESPDMAKVKQQLLKSFDYLFSFNGSGHMEVDMKILKRGQKEVMIRCGRSYRFVLDSEKIDSFE